MEKFHKNYSTKKTPQSQKIPGSSQVKNSAGGFVWQVDDWTRLDRFLILGSEGGTYYIKGPKLTVENAEAVLRCIEANGVKTVQRIVEVSEQGLAAKNDPAIFALAMAAKLGDDVTRKAAYTALPKVCRIGTHLFHFAEYVEAFGGWGRGLRNAVSAWYNDKRPGQLAHQLVKYRQRDGWSHRDLIRLAHPKAVSDEHNSLLRYAVKGEVTDGVGSLIQAVEELKGVKQVRKVVRLITEHNLPRECVPTEWLNKPEVWEALLQRMPMTAMVRNLGNMSKAGLFEAFSENTKQVVARLGDKEALISARVHPLQILVAMNTYKSGQGFKGSNTWEVNSKIVNALDGAFYKAFKAVTPSGKNMLLALDVSGSMGWGEIAGMPGITPRVGSAAMALVTAAVEENTHFVAFTGGGGRWGGGYGLNRASETNALQCLTELDVTPRMRLDTVIKKISNLRFGGTDCALPMLWALKKKVKVDTFCIYTDSETWVGNVHPTQALQKYRREINPGAKLVVIGMTSSGFSIASPDDSGQLDLVGFSASTPKIISQFSVGFGG